MKPKFKIGDKVKFDNKQFIIKDIEIEFCNEMLSPLYFIDDWTLEEDLEIVETSEQIAVNKYKEELIKNIENLDKKWKVNRYKLDILNCNILDDYRKDILELIK